MIELATGSTLTLRYKSFIRQISALLYNRVIHCKFEFDLTTETPSLSLEVCIGKNVSQAKHRNRGSTIFHFREWISVLIRLFNVTAESIHLSLKNRSATPKKKERK